MNRGELPGRTKGRPDRLPHGTSKEDMMEKDPVCGMQVDPAKAAGTSERNGKTYYFCSPRCKQKFDADPKQYGA